MGSKLSISSALSGFTVDCLHTGHHGGVGTLGTLFLLPTLDKLIANCVVDNSRSFVIKKMFNVILAPIQFVCIEWDSFYCQFCCVL